MDFSVPLHPGRGVSTPRWRACSPAHSFLVAMLVALALGLRHASDPDHLVAVTSLVAADRGDVRGAARLGAWWGVGHAAALLALGIPLILLEVIAAGLAREGRRDGRRRGDPGPWRCGSWSSGSGATTALGSTSHRGGCRRRSPPPLPREATPSTATAGCALRSRPSGSASCTASPGPAPSSLLLIAALPSKLEAAAALAVFAPMSVSLDDALHHRLRLAADAPRRLVDPLFRTVLIPAFGLFGSCSGPGTSGSAERPAGLSARRAPVSGRR